MKKLLIISSSFPPAGGSGTFRTLKFVKYLPIFNWQPFILTTSERYYEKKDFTMLAEIPDCARIFRTTIFSPFRIFVKLNAYIKSFKQSSSSLSKESSHIQEKSESDKSKKSSQIITYLRFIDSYLDWLPFAVIKGLYIIRKYKIDAIYSTSPIPITHVIGLLLHKLTGLKWIVDFRDPWIFQKLLRKERSDVFLSFEKKLESTVVKNSNHVICNTLRLLEKFRENYSNYEQEKFVYIPNGYDPDDFKKSNKKIKPFPIFTITHTGEFYEKGRTPDSFLIAVSELLESGAIKSNEIKVIFVGGGEYSESSQFKDFLKSNNLEEVVDIIFHLPHKMSIEFLYKSSALLLLQPGKVFTLQVPAKVFEYAYIRKPILALAPESATTDIVRSLKNGFVVDPDNIDDMKENIFELFKRFKSNDLKTVRWYSYLNKLNRKKQTHDLVKLLSH